MQKNRTPYSRGGHGARSDVAGFPRQSLLRAAFRASVAAGQSGWNAWGSPRLAGAFRLRAAGGQAEKECRAGNAGSLQRGEETTGSAIGRFGGHRQRAAEFGRAPRNGPATVDPKNGSRPRVLNVEVVIMIQHAQRRRGRRGSPGG